MFNRIEGKEVEYTYVRGGRIMSLIMKIQYLIIIFIPVSVLFSIINFSAYLKGSMPSISQALSSMFYILLWFLCTFFMNNKNIGIKASSWFWGGGTLLLIVGYLGNLGLISIPALFIFAGPLYGLRYFIEMPSDIYFALICVVISYCVCVIGWLLGKLKSR